MKHKKHSLSAKNALSIILTALVLSAAAIFISYFTFAEQTDQYYKNTAENVAQTAAAFMDGDTVGTYLETMEKDAGYERMLADLYKIRENNDALYLYVQKLTTEGSYSIMDADPTENAYQLGDFLPIQENFKAKAEAGVRGEDIPATITHTGYGWLVTKYIPIFDSSGNVAAHVGVDIGMDEIMAHRMNFLLLLTAVMAVAAVVFVLIFVRVSRKTIVEPINKLAAAATAYVSEKQEHLEGASAISALRIATGDEIENLTSAIQSMERDINTYIKDLTAVTAEKERVSAELSIASTIQAGMLPCVFPPFPENDKFDIFAKMIPAKEVGGDFYDFFMIDEDHIAIVIADVSGKGVPAALFMVIAKTLIKNYAQTGMDIEQVFEKANNALCENNEAALFVTAWLGVITLSTGEMRWVNAGHNRPLICKKGGAYYMPEQKRGFVLAGMEGMKYHAQSVMLEKGDRVFIYTDGINEATDSAEQLYGDGRLIAILDETRGMGIHDILDSVKASIDEFVGEAPQFDDITMLLFEYGREEDEDGTHS